MREASRGGGAAGRPVANARLFLRQVTSSICVQWHALLSYNGCQRWGGSGRAVALRILVSLEDDYRTYREVLAAGIRILRPRAEVVTAELDALNKDEVRRFDPHVVICSLPASAGHGDILGWVDLSLQTSRPTVVCIDGRYSERTNLTLEELQRVLDEVEHLI
jgi:hypothetical protein